MCVSMTAYIDFIKKLMKVVNEFTPSKEIKIKNKI